MSSAGRRLTRPRLTRTAAAPSHGAPASTHEVASLDWSHPGGGGGPHVEVGGSSAALGSTAPVGTGSGYAAAALGSSPMMTSAPRREVWFLAFGKSRARYTAAPGGRRRGAADYGGASGLRDVPRSPGDLGAARCATAGPKALWRTGGVQGSAVSFRRIGLICEPRRKGPSGRRSWQRRPRRQDQLGLPLRESGERIPAGPRGRAVAKAGAHGPGEHARPAPPSQDPIRQGG